MVSNGGEACVCAGVGLATASAGALDRSRAPTAAPLRRALRGARRSPSAPPRSGGSAAGAGGVDEQQAVARGERGVDVRERVASDGDVPRRRSFFIRHAKLPGCPGVSGTSQFQTQTKFVMSYRTLQQTVASIERGLDVRRLRHADEHLTAVGRRACRRARAHPSSAPQPAGGGSAPRARQISALPHRTHQDVSSRRRRNRRASAPPFRLPARSARRAAETDRVDAWLAQRPAERELVAAARAAAARGGAGGGVPRQSCFARGIGDPAGDEICSRPPLSPRLPGGPARFEFRETPRPPHGTPLATRRPPPRPRDTLVTPREAVRRSGSSYPRPRDTS